jgi:subtilisin family serine protease
VLAGGAGDERPRFRIDVGRGPFEELPADRLAVAAPVMPTVLVAPLAGSSASVPKEAWGISAMRADRSSLKGKGVVVAVLDTGIDADHPAFNGVKLCQRDFTGTGNGDRHGHGTHCAGIVFGRDVEGQRIGVARGVTKALIGKVLGDDGHGESSWILQALQWAVDERANVISLSLGLDFPGLVKQRVAQGWPADLATSVALNAYRANLRLFDTLMGFLDARRPLGGGTIVVAAAGNESRREIDPSYEIGVALPAAARDVVSVGALERTPDGLLTVAKFSNTLPEVTAPGVNIVSAKIGGGLQELSGTSMAAPHVAGAAALWWERMGAGADARQVRECLTSNAKTDVFVPGVAAHARGRGLVRVPPRRA